MGRACLWTKAPGVRINQKTPSQGNATLPSLVPLGAVVFLTEELRPLLCIMYVVPQLLASDMVDFIEHLLCNVPRIIHLHGLSSLNLRGRYHYFLWFTSRETGEEETLYNSPKIQN